jgi:hypothetical protein
MARRTAIAYQRSGEALQAPGDLEVLASETDLASALARLAEDEAEVLLVARLGGAAGSLGELVRLLDWLAEVGADLVAADVGLDTATSAGQRSVALVREIERWGRDPEHPRRPRGRPGLSTAAPELAQRIATLREEGLSLHAIAEQLNREGVPTPRGGATWRASSVQSAIGYRRPPPPPAPGAPPPHRHKPGRPPPHGHGPKRHGHKPKPPPPRP